MVFLVVSFVVSFLHYPFFLTGDSWIWLSQARSGEWLDIQPIGTIAIWSLLDRLYPGPFLFVLLNILLVVSGTVLIVFRSIRSVVLASVLVAFCVFYPVTFSAFGLAWRDITGLGLVLVSLGLTSFLFNSQRATATLAVLGAIAVIAAIGPIFRFNDAAGMAPILYTALFVSILPRSSARLRLASALAATILFLSMATVAAMAITKSLASENSYAQQVRRNHFLSRLSLETGRNLMPAALYPDLTLGHIEELMGASRIPYTVFWRAFWRENTPFLPRLRSSRDYAVLDSTYSAAVRRYPLAALKVRLRILREVLFGLPVNGSYVVFYHWRSQLPVAYPGVVEVNFDITPPRWTRSSLKTLLPSIASRLPGPPLVYLLVVAFATGFAIRLEVPDRRLITLASASALTHYLGVVLAVHRYENRYGHQSIYLCLLATGLFVGSWLEARTRKRSNTRPAEPGRAETKRPEIHAPSSSGLEEKDGDSTRDQHGAKRQEESAQITSNEDGDNAKSMMGTQETVERQLSLSNSEIEKRFRTRPVTRPPARIPSQPKSRKKSVNGGMPILVKP